MKHRVDAQSRDTTYAGLPKSVKIHSVAAQGPGAASVWGALTFDTVDWNYGGFAFAYSGGRIVGPLISEPGIYDVRGYWQISDTGAREMFIAVTVNGAPPGADEQPGHPFPASTISPRVEISQLMEFKPGDFPALMFFTTAASTFIASKLTITKLGGQY